MDHFENETPRFSAVDKSVFFSGPGFKFLRFFETVFVDAMAGARVYSSEWLFRKMKQKKRESGLKNSKMEV